MRNGKKVTSNKPNTASSDVCRSISMNCRDDKKLVVQCRSGARSAIGASVLQAAGFKNVVNLTGGYVAWKSGWTAEREVAACDERQA